MNYDEKPEASKCSTCRRRGRDNYHSKKRMRTDDGHSAREFCTLVNTMTQEDNEVIDVHTLLKYASGHEVDGRELDVFHCEESGVHSQADKFSMNFEEDKDMDLFASTWLQEVATSN